VENCDQYSAAKRKRRPDYVGAETFVSHQERERVLIEEEWQRAGADGKKKGRWLRQRPFFFFGDCLRYYDGASA
jgi:hypothetical protein